MLGNKPLSHKREVDVKRQAVVSQESSREARVAVFHSNQQRMLA
jgi:hypothetical protein